METKVYVIIVTYNAMQWVDRCLGSLRYSSIPVKTVVIDNLSKDGTVEYIKKIFPEAHLIINKENRGFGQANNQGIEFAYNHGASHFFLLNQDAWVHEDTIQKLIEVQDKYEIAIASPVHLNGAGDRMDRMFFSYIFVGENNNDFASGVMLNQCKDYYKVGYVNAAAWMMSRNCIETIGGFDPVFFHYGEDSNYLQRLSYHKKRLAVIPDCYINHDREEHGNLNMYKKHIYARKLIIEYSNINKRFLCLDKYRIKFMLIYLREVTKMFVTLRWKQLYYLLSDFVMFLKKLKPITLSRRENVKTRANWLNINFEKK